MGRTSYWNIKGLLIPSNCARQQTLSIIGNLLRALVSGNQKPSNFLSREYPLKAESCHRRKAATLGRQGLLCWCDVFLWINPFEHLCLSPPPVTHNTQHRGLFYSYLHTIHFTPVSILKFSSQLLPLASIIISLQSFVFNVCLIHLARKYKQYFHYVAGVRHKIMGRWERNVLWNLWREKSNKCLEFCRSQWISFSNRSL